MKTADDIVEKYLNFGGTRFKEDFVEFLIALTPVKNKYDRNTKEYLLVEYVEHKLLHGLALCIQYSEIYAVIDEDSKEDILDILKDKGYLSGIHKTYTVPKTHKPTKPKRKERKTARKKRSLGKLVDHGNPAPRGKSDIYWRRNGIEVVLKPNDPKIRNGEKIPESYEYANVRFLENYYSLKGIEFGNWLSQQDRINYLSGLGIALFDLYKVLKFTPKQISLAGKLSVAFGARGRGMALAHFEPGSFAINLTRYSRPQKLKSRPASFKRVDLILKDGGIGAFAHEYGHALDYYGGLYAEKGDTFSLSGDKSTDLRPDKDLLKKNTLRGLMEKLLFKILWKSPNSKSAYHTRLIKSAITDYYIQRNEIFARAFEIYVHFKLAKAKFKNAFLTFTKYDTSVYMTHTEMKSVEKEFDTLMNALKKNL